MRLPVRLHRSTLWVLGVLGLIVLLNVVLGIAGFPLLLSYEVHKALHVLGAVLFLGNIVVTGAWMMMAERAGDPGVLAFSATTTNWMDAFFTAPGVLLLLVNGQILAEELGGPFSAPWLVLGWAFLLAGGVVWGATLVPLQERMIRLTRGGKVDASFPRALHLWYVFGIVATALPLAAMVVMVVKPGA